MRKSLFGIIIAATLLLAAQKGDRAETQLQAAINKEVVEGDLKGAIEQYRKIAQGMNRAVVAKALVRMGQCYERLGDIDARKAYERVIRDFADQKDMAAEAQNRLASLGGERRGTAAMTLRRLSAGKEPDDEGAPSPDGQWLSYTSPDGDLGIYNLLSGERRLLKRNPPNSHGGVEESIWSPDGKQIAYGWDYCGPDCVELRIMQADGSGDRTLYRNEKLYYVEPFDWSPDGKYISAALIRNGLGRDLALVNARTGESQALKSFPPSQQVREALFSPDSRYLAYDAPQQPGDAHRDIWLMSLDGSQVPLVQNPADDRMLAWLPGGVLFASDRTGTMDIWMQPVAKGKPQGPPERLKAGIGNLECALGLTRQGSLYYSVSTAVNDVFVASIDRSTGKVAGRALPASQRHAGQYGFAAWSPDGRRLAAFAKLSSKGPFKLIAMHDMTNGEERDLKSSLQELHSVDWTPDGQSLLVTGMSEDKRLGIFRMDPQTGNATPLRTSDAQLQNPKFSPDGKTLYYVERTSKTAIVAYEPASESERVVIDGKNFGGRGFRWFALSPDGEQIAFASEETGSLVVVGAKGGDPRKLYETKPDLLQYMGVTWSADGRYLLFVQRPNLRSPFELWRISASGGQPESLGLSATGLHAPRVHPDGTRIAFSSGDLRGREIWVLENFLPAAAAAR